MDGGGDRIWRRSLHSCIAAVVLFAGLAGVRLPAAAAATVAPTWSRIRYDAANTGFNPNETSLSGANVASLAEDWSTKATRSASPVVAGGVIYTGCDPNHLCALDATNGTVRWKTSVGDTVAPRSAALVGDTVYVGASRPPTVYALKASTGALLWKTLVSNRAGDFVTPVVVADGLVLQGIYGFLLAWDAATGIQRWVIPLDVRGAPAVANGVVYVMENGASPKVHALRLTTGETLWRTAPTSGFAGRSPVVTNGLVVVGATQLYTASTGVLSAFRAAGCGTAVCSPVWSYDYGRSPVGDAAAANGILYQGFMDGYYVAFDVATGRPLWKAATDGASAPVTPATRPPTVANGLLFAQGGDGEIYAWSAGGCAAAVCQPLWKAPAGGGSIADGEVVILGGRLYAADDDGVLHAYSARQNPPPPNAPPPVGGPEVPPAPPASGTINVPSEELSIQRAIEAARPGDVVVVAPGVYHERLDFQGKAVEVRSSGGPGVTTIDGDGISAVVLFESNETRASILRGFTITHGKNEWGGGIRVGWSSPTIVENVIAGNLAYDGSGIEVQEGAPAIVRNQIRDNHPIPASSGGGGGGIDLRSSGGAEVRGNVIEDNSADRSGGGLAASSDGPITIVDNVIRRNLSSDGGGGVALGGGSGVLLVQNLIVENRTWGSGGGVAVTGAPTLLANTIAANTAQHSSGVSVSYVAAGMALKGNLITGGPGVPAVECSTMYSSALPSFADNLVYNETLSPSWGCDDHSLSADPRLVNAGSGDYRLGRGSPAIDVGNPSPLLPSIDIAGAPRVVDGNGDGVAAVDMGAYEGQPPFPEVGDGFHPLPPARILDTRSGPPLGAGGTLDMLVTGRGGIPASGVSSVVLNVTVTQATATSFLTAWPTGVARPNASNLNYVSGQTVPNLVTVKVGEGGKVSLYNNSGSTHVVVDVAGWFGPSGGSRYTPLAPSRILDTRAGNGAPAAPVGAASALTLQVTGRGGMPDTGVSAVVLNVTVTEPTATSFVTAWPAGTPRPLASNLNDVAGQTVPNLIVVKVGDGGRVNLYNNAGTVHLIADVAGWYGDGTSGGAGFMSMTPARFLDTRTESVKPGPGNVVDVQVAGRGGVPATGVTAVVLNVTVTEPTATSYLTAWPAGLARPLASNLNYVDGETVPNLVVVKLGRDGQVSLYNNLGSTHIVVDVAGWYAA